MKPFIKIKDSASNTVKATDSELIKKYRRLKIYFTILLLIFTAVIFFNIDYFIFKVFITSSYAYTETLDKIYEDSLGTEDFKSYFRNFDRAVISVFTEKIRAESDDRYTYLYTPQSYKESKNQTKADAKDTEIRELDSNCIYIRLPNISSYTRKYLIKNKELLAEYKNIIIDLRSNYGGMLNDYYKISELFLDKGAIIGYENVRPGVFSRTIKSRKTRYFDFENIVILQNGETASAAEGFIMSLKENLDNVTLIGSRTFGKGIGQATVPLTFGYAVKATVLKLGTPSGGSIHLRGIDPDIECSDNDFENALYRR